MARFIRPSTTQSAVALWAKAVLQALVGLAIFVIALPWLTDWLLPHAVERFGAQYKA